MPEPIPSEIELDLEDPDGFVARVLIRANVHPPVQAFTDCHPDRATPGEGPRIEDFEVYSVASERLLESDEYELWGLTEEMVGDLYHQLAAQAGFPTWI